MITTDVYEEKEETDLMINHETLMENDKSETVKPGILSKIYFKIYFKNS